MDISGIFLTAAQEMVSPTTAAFVVAAIALNLQFGYGGLLNFGQAGFMAVGAYVFAMTTLHFEAGFFTALTVALAACAFYALALGLPTLRLRADYLAIVTLAAAEIIRYLVTTNGMQSLTGGSHGLYGYSGSFWSLGPFASNATWMLVASWSVVVVVATAMALLMRTPWGRTVRGMREDDQAAVSLGKDVTMLKLQILTLGGVIAGLAGILYVLPRSVQPGNFNPIMTFFIWTALLLGGAATIWGPIIGTMLFWFLFSLANGVLIELHSNGFLPFLSSTQLGPIRYMLVGIVLFALVVGRPQGLFATKRSNLFLT